jgi:hypothetical protein
VRRCKKSVGQKAFPSLNLQAGDFGLLPAEGDSRLLNLVLYNSPPPHTSTPIQPFPHVILQTLVLTMEITTTTPPQPAGSGSLRRLIFKHCTLKIGNHEMKKNSIKRK